MFDKNGLNNQISSSKNSMKRAKVLVINKLVKKCRKLKEQMKRNSNDKIIRKVDTITKQISAIKKQKCLETLKKALLFDKNPKSILTNGNATVAEIAEMLMFSNKVVIEIVQRLKTCFNLNDDTNPNWRELFHKGKKSEYKSKSKNIRIRKKNYMETEKCESNNANKSQTGAILCNNEDSDRDQIKKTQNDLDLDLEKKQISVTAKMKKIPIKIIEDNSFDSHKQVSDSKKFISQSDPFFTTDSGQNYMSTICLENQMGDEDNETTTDHENANNKYNRNIGFLNSKKERYNEYNLNKKNVQNKTEFNQNENTFNVRKDTFNRMDKNKHPSWVAKQKIKPIIHKFVGKKTTFGDLENAEYDPSLSTEDNSNKNQPQYDFTTSENNIGDKNHKSIPDLHPSWQAKQKTRPIIQEFKGKKITFDE